MSSSNDHHKKKGKNSRKKGTLSSKYHYIFVNGERKLEYFVCRNSKTTWNFEK